MALRLGIKPQALCTPSASAPPPNYICSPLQYLYQGYVSSEDVEFCSVTSMLIRLSEVFLNPWSKTQRKQNTKNKSQNSEPPSHCGSVLIRFSHTGQGCPGLWLSLYFLLPQSLNIQPEVKVEYFLRCSVSTCPRPVWSPNFLSTRGAFPSLLSPGHFFLQPPPSPASQYACCLPIHYLLPWLAEASIFSFYCFQWVLPKRLLWPWESWAVFGTKGSPQVNPLEPLNRSKYIATILC